MFSDNPPGPRNSISGRLVKRTAINMSSTIDSIEYHGQPALQLTCASGASAVISLFGAQVLSWKPDGRTERLHLSERAHFDDKTPIRGGIPVCFPQFAALGKLPRHGFLRTMNWQSAQQRSEQDFAMATLTAASDEHTQSLWPHMFSAELTVLIEGTRLDVELEIRNDGYAPFAFTAALHTYLRVDEVENARLAGLHGHQYLDAGGKQPRRDNDEVLTINDEIDRIYHDVGHPLVLVDGDREMRLQNSGFPDVVIWNPWEQKSAQLDDMPERGFRRMLCIEAAATRTRIALDAGTSWTGRQTLLAN